MRPTLDNAMLLLLLLTSTVHAQPGVRCSLNVRSLNSKPPRQPLYLVPGGSKDAHGFVIPDSKGMISFQQNDKVLIACPGSVITLSGRSVQTASCISGTTFFFNNRAVEFTDLKCRSRVERKSRRTGRLCGSQKQYELVQIGFEVGYDFYTLIEVCFNSRAYITVYARSTLLPQIAGKQKGYSTATWWKEDFFPTIEVTKQYTKNTQIDTVAKLLRNKTLAEHFIPRDGCVYLIKGHLTARCDLMLGSQQDATFMYINAVPQWQNINCGNWKTLETNIRRRVGASRLPLEIYTGSYGIATLPDGQNVQTEIYLYADNNRRLIPVPKIVWKIVYEPTSKSAVVFVTSNNPYDANRGMLCPRNICNQINWLTWQPNDQRLGYSYCCDYRDFINTVVDVPPLTVTGIFT